MTRIKEIYKNKIVPELKEQFNLKNQLQILKQEKVLMLALK